MTLEERKKIFTVIDKFGEYTLLVRNNLILGDKYIIAWLFDEDTYTWSQGHYYSDILKVAIAITNLHRNKIGYNRLEEIASVAINNLDTDCFDYFLEDADLTQDEAEYFGIEETIGWKEYSDSYEIRKLEDC